MDVGSSMREGVSGDDTFLNIPTLDERRQLYTDFYQATSNEAMKFGICAVCAR